MERGTRECSTLDELLKTFLIRLEVLGMNCPYCGGTMIKGLFVTGETVISFRRGPLLNSGPRAF